MSERMTDIGIDAIRRRRSEHVHKGEFCEKCVEHGRSLAAPAPALPLCCTFAPDGGPCPIHGQRPAPAPALDRERLARVIHDDDTTSHALHEAEWAGNVRTWPCRPCQRAAEAIAAEYAKGDGDG